MTSSSNAPASEISDLADIKKQHEELLGRFNKEISPIRKPFSGDLQKRQVFLNDVSALLRKIEKEAPRINAADAYIWLNHAVRQWQLRCEDYLGHQIYIPVLRPPTYFTVGTTLTDDKIVDFITRTAGVVSSTRRYIMAKETMAEALKQLEAYSSKEQRDWDWLHAEIYFATDILYARGAIWKELDVEGGKPKDMWRYLTRDTFAWLERVWLRDVFQLRAYERWEKEGTVTPDINIHRGTYFEVCREFRELIAKEEDKFDAEAHQDIYDYIEERYLIKGEDAIDRSKDDLRKLLEKKRARIIELNAECDTVKARTRAERCVLLFYQNIREAVLGRKDDASKMLLQAFEESEQNQEYASIANGLEALIMRYYVKCNARS